MPLPVEIAGSGIGWPTHLNSRVGPFQSGTSLYVIGCDATNNKARCYRSTDAGFSWAEVDSANAPATGTTSATRTYWVQQDGTSLYVFQVLSASSIQIKPFSCSSDTWQTAVTGPTITVNSSDLATGSPLFGCRRSDGSYVIAYNGATEANMGTNYSRVKLHYRTSGGTWNGPYDIQGSASTPANTLPGTQQHFSMLSAQLGVSDRVHLWWIEGTTNFRLRHRSFTSSDTFSTAIDVGATAITLETDGDYPVGLPTSFTRSGTTYVALPYVPRGVDELREVRCDSASADTAANWTVTTIYVGVLSYRAANSSSLVGDGGRLWAWYVQDDTLGSGFNYFRYSVDVGGGVWQEMGLWREGVTSGLSYAPAISAYPLTDTIGYVYQGGSFARPQYDRLPVFAPKVSASVGSASKTFDLGATPPVAFTIVVDAGDAADPAGTIEATVDGSWDNGSFQTLASSGPMAVQMFDSINLVEPPRYVKVTVTVTDSASIVGVAGT